MSQKTENWQEALQRVRQGLKENSEPVVEKTEDEVISEEIDGLLNDFEETPVEISEVSDKEIGAMKKLSKDMQAVLKGYQKIMGMGDKELKDRKYNDNYEAILDARNKVLTLIGTLTTKQQLESVDVETAGISQRMMKTYALVHFPDDVKLQAVQHVQQSLQHQRAWTVGVTAACLGLVVMLGAGLIQLAGSSARIVRRVGVPLVALLILPGVAVSSRLVQRVVSHKNADLQSPFVLPDTEIDFDWTAEAEVSLPGRQDG